MGCLSDNTNLNIRKESLVEKKRVESI